MNTPPQTWTDLSASECWTLLDRCIARVMPPAWQCVLKGADGARYEHARTGQAVILSVCREADGRRWVHLSTSFARRLPTWEELRATKNLFLGREVTALQVLPRESEYVNVHPYTLHLWVCTDGDATPDFRKDRTL